MSKQQESLFAEFCWHQFYYETCRTKEQCRRTSQSTKTHVIQLLKNPLVLLLIPQGWQKETIHCPPRQKRKTGEPLHPRLGRPWWKGPKRPPAPLIAAYFINCSIVGNRFFLTASWFSSVFTDSQVNPHFHWQYRIKRSVWCHMQIQTEDWIMNVEIKNYWTKKREKTCSSSTQQYCIGSLGHDIRNNHF